MKHLILRLIFSICLVSTLAGCEIFLLGSAAVATYEVVKDERSAAEVATDTKIVADIKQKLLRDNDVKGWDINVDSFKTEVTLYGNVPSEAVKEKIILLSSSVKGVSKIINKMVIVE